jgi:hypothetical protein
MKIDFLKIRTPLPGISAHPRQAMAFETNTSSHAPLLRLLRSTLDRLEQTEGLQHDDPALIEIKSSILLAIAELELNRDSTARAA